MFIVGKIKGVEHFVNAEIVLDIFRVGNSVLITFHSGNFKENFESAVTDVITEEFAEFQNTDLAEKAMQDFSAALMAGLNLFSFTADNTSDIFDDYEVPF